MATYNSKGTKVSVFLRDIARSDFLIVNIIKNSIKFFLNKVGYDIVLMGKIPAYIVDKQVRKIIQEVNPYTKVGSLNLYNLIGAIKYIVKNQIPGDVVECGVWKGGCMMAAAKALNLYQDDSRTLFLYDTFEGMSSPTNHDVSVFGGDISEMMRNTKKSAMSIHCYVPLEEVESNMGKTNYDKNKIKYIKGKVEDTLHSDNIPEKISLLRLDTDWYESTKVELEKLWPRLSVGGYIIIDDYGAFLGCKKAVDEYFEKLQFIPFVAVGAPLIGVKIKN